jgi:hypothetical protein
MSEIKNIVNVTIERQTQAVSRAGFGTFAIIAEFTANKTNTVFSRTRLYGSLSEMVDDGWSGFDAVYKAAQKLFSQNPNPGKVLVGRRTSTDTTWGEALLAIKNENNDWYAFTVVAKSTMNVTISDDFVTGNVVSGEVNGIAWTANFTTDQQGTMGAIKTAIETAINTATFTVGASPYRTATVSIPNTYVSFTMNITGGATQPTITLVNNSDITDQNIKDVAEWTETETKLYFYNSNNSNILDISISSDIASFLKASSYDRTIGVFHKNDALTNIESAWTGACLPFDPGSQTWAYKRLAGVLPYNLTGGERGSVSDKNINIYTTIGGVNVTEEGKVASGEWIDIMRGIDWLQARLQEDTYALLVNNRKIPFTDGGIAVIEGTVKAVLLEASNQGILIEESIILTVPQAANVSTADKAARLLPNINFSADLQGAIHKLKINGVVSL